jgi:hypothetical protein
VTLGTGCNLSSTGVSTSVGVTGPALGTGTPNPVHTPTPTPTSTPTPSITPTPTPGPGVTWFIRTDGGTRYSANVTTGQCDGKADVAYPGTGTNQHCAFNDLRYMWLDGTYGNSAWVMSGGDTLVIRGCSALASQQNPDAPHCRIGSDKATGNDAQNFWCAGVSTYCSMPPPPSGTASQHTRILGACAYGTYSCNPLTAYPYTNNNLTQVFGGFGVGVDIYLSGSQYVDLEGLEVTAHNGQCARYGTTNPLPGCSRQNPYSDQADQGIVTNNTTANILLQDVYVHGFSSNGITGPIGGAMTLNRVFIGFNAFAGWNFDDGVPTANAVGSTITQSYVTMIGNGCQEEYPIVHTQFPAKGCWDSATGGFGDAWSGQNSTLASFTCDHCNISYNAKDGALGPHTIVHNISLTNSIWAGNMGQAGKWGQDANASFLFQNNILLGNCMRMSATLPGAAQNFNASANLVGSGLSGFCRAAGPVFDYFAGSNSSVHFNNNTVVTYQPTIFEPGCFTANGCANAPIYFTNNLILGYTSSYTSAPFNPGSAPGLYYKDDPSVLIVPSHNIEYGIRNGDTCGTNGTICTDPLLVNEPAQGSIPPEGALDTLNFHPSLSSPAVNAGASYTGSPTLDFYGTAYGSTLPIGAVKP